jgi:hypothetical protein
MIVRKGIRGNISTIITGEVTLMEALVYTLE